MLDEKFTAALLFLARKLDRTRVKWSLFGGSALAIRNYPIHPVDIDILCGIESAGKIARLFPESTRTILPKRGNRAACEKFVLGIGDVQVDIVCELPVADFGVLERIPLGKREIPVRTIGTEIAFYKSIRKFKRARELSDWRKKSAVLESTD
ncbi:MAG: hypothetical protein V1820_01125 [archaeon]